ncbi:MAG: ATP-binding cassette domain-containing protein, partial [Pirellulaceae bacterium]|nr:ATP-binding cassette domain-containing protein [Pirellulaceae bacterium]
MVDHPNSIRSRAPEVVRVESLHFGYEASRPVIQGMSACLERGRLCALIGPNAAGKSTLLRLMLGQLRPWSGTV